MLQLKKRGDSKSGWRFMVTICFYQDTRHEKPLRWIRQRLGIGYISRRNDGMTELRINGYDQCERILRTLIPYIRFKRSQGIAVIRAMKILKAEPAIALSVAKKRRLISCIEIIQQENYQSRGKRSAAMLGQMLGLTP